MKSKRSKQCDISQKVKEQVYERDKFCIYCGNPNATPSCHYIPRSKGGLGVEQNIVTLCQSCHYNYDMTNKREHYKQFIQNYLKSHYEDWNEQDLIYRK